MMFWARIRIDTENSTQENREVFYTSLFKALLHPSIFSDVDGNYLGFNESIYTTDKVASTQRQRVQYQYFSGWDTYRSQAQLVSLIDPEASSDMAQSLINNSKQANCDKGKDLDKGNCSGGAFTQWGVANDDAAVMAGDPGSIIVANAFAFGAREFKLSEAIGGMNRYNSPSKNKANDLYGYESETTAPTDVNGHNTFSQNLELAASTFASAAFAAYVNRYHAQLVSGQLEVGSITKDQYATHASTFFTRSETEAGQALDPGLEARLLENAQEFNNALSTFNGGDYTNCQEGTRAQYLWMYPVNAGSIPSRYSGALESWYNSLAEENRLSISEDDSSDEKQYKRAISALDNHLVHINGGHNTQYLWFGNEPGHFDPFIYNFLGVSDTAPSAYKSQNVVRRILEDLYANSIDKGISGNDDLGAVTAWFVWGAMGLYPAVPGIGVYTITTPLFKSIEIDKHGAVGTITLKAPDVTEGTGGARFIKGIKLKKGSNAASSYTKSYIKHDELYSVDNIELEYDVTATSGDASTTLEKSPSFPTLQSIKDFF